MFKKRGLVQTISYKMSLINIKKKTVSNTHLYERFHSKTRFRTQAKSHVAVVH